MPALAPQLQIVCVPNNTYLFADVTAKRMAMHARQDVRV